VGITSSISQIKRKSKHMHGIGRVKQVRKYLEAAAENNSFDSDILRGTGETSHHLGNIGNFYFVDC